MARVIVIGAGHNGLVAACRLAGSGHQVTVLERRSKPGGVAAGEEFHPGYRHTGVLHDAGRFSPMVEKELSLGLRRRAPTTVFVRGSQSRSIGAELDVPNPKAWAAFTEQLDEIRVYASSVLSAPPPRTDADAPLWPLAKTALGFRRLGNTTMMELLRIGPTAVDDWLEEFFHDPLLRGGLALAGLHGTWMGPRSPTSTATLLLQESLRGEEVIGGPAAVVEALVSCVVARGATIRCDSCVTRIRSDQRVHGVDLEGGEKLDADAVFLACDPKHGLLDLVDPLQLPPALERDISDVRARGLTAKVHFALSGPPEFTGRSGAHAHVVAPGHPLELERAFDAVKYRGFADWLPLDLRMPTVHDTTLAPAGHHVLSALVHGVPFALEGGWTDEARERLGSVVLRSLEAVAPGIGALVVGQEVLSPADLAKRFTLPEGHLWHGEHAIDQLFVARPFLGTAQYRTAIDGLFLASSGTHPGGGITGLPGWLAGGVL